MTRLARGSMPWPVQRDGRPACHGSLTVEHALTAGIRLRVMAWLRFSPDGTPWLSLECSPYPKGGCRPTTADKCSSE
jgi:hypothetical protein